MKYLCSTHFGLFTHSLYNSKRRRIRGMPRNVLNCSKPPTDYRLTTEKEYLKSKTKKFKHGPDL